jgi:hypothetical protein
LKPSGNQSAVERYFTSMNAALDGLGVFLSGTDSPLYSHELVGRVIAPYLEKLATTFSCWEHRIGFVERFRIDQADSGFPVFQNMLELEADRKDAAERLKHLDQPDVLKAKMTDHILARKGFPTQYQEDLAERTYLEHIQKGEIFSSLMLPETVKISINPRNKRPFYVAHWATFDGTRTLPIVYMAVIEDSSKKIAEMLIGRDEKLKPNLNIPLPVGGLLNPEFALGFDEFVERNSGYSLSPITIAQNLDKDFEYLHPKQLRRFILGPFYCAGLTENNDRVSKILSKVRKPENAWVLTWTMQEVFSKAERPAKRGIWSSEPAREEFHIKTEDLEATRQGVSHYEKHALVPHDAYQALYADGKAAQIFDGFTVHVISGNQVIGI